MCMTCSTSYCLYDIVMDTWNACIYNKTIYLQFRTKNGQKLDSNITLLKNQIANSTNTKFLGLTIEETL
jgi:hypothetical protein